MSVIPALRQLRQENWHEFEQVWTTQWVPSYPGLHGDSFLKEPNPKGYWREGVTLITAWHLEPKSPVSIGEYRNKSQAFDSAKHSRCSHSPACAFYLVLVLTHPSYCASLFLHHDSAQKRGSRKRARKLCGRVEDWGAGSVSQKPSVPFCA